MTKLLYLPALRGLSRSCSRPMDGVLSSKRGSAPPTALAYVREYFAVVLAT